ncbi:MAG: hypothetical protein ACLGI8_02280 [Acidimicrobiia bacterium]
MRWWVGGAVLALVATWGGVLLLILGTEPDQKVRGATAIAGAALIIHTELALLASRALLLMLGRFEEFPAGRDGLE